MLARWLSKAACPLSASSCRSNPGAASGKNGCKAYSSGTNLNGLPDLLILVAMKSSKVIAFEERRLKRKRS